MSETNTQNVCPFCGGPGYHVRGCKSLNEVACAWCATLVPRGDAITIEGNLYCRECAKSDSRLQEKQARNWCEEHQFNYSDDPELGCPWCECKHLEEVADGVEALTELNNQHCETIGNLEEQLDTIEGVLMRTEEELNAANKAANEAEAKVSLYAASARVIALHLKELCDESLPYDEMIADAARKAGAEISKLESQFQKAKEWNALCELELNNLRSRLDEAEEDMSVQGVRMGEAQETIYALKNALRELCEKLEAGIGGEDETKRARALLEKLK